MRLPALPPARALRRAALLVPLLAAAACASAEKRYEQGVRLEQEGRPAEAAARYADALRRDPSLAEARVRLRETGDAAVRQSLREAALLEGAARLDEAAGALLEAEDLSRRAAAVGVALALPDDFTARRRGLFDRAIAGALDASRELSRAGSHDEADRRLAMALERYAPSASQADALLRARTEVGAEAAGADLRAGRYRAAYERVERLRQGAPDGAAALLEPALAVQEEALRRGTRRLVVLPVTVRREQARKLPDDFERDLDFALEDGEWRRPPLFVEVVDPSRARAAFRRHDAARRGLSAWDAAEMGRGAGADLVLLLEVDSVARGLERADTVRRPARTRAGLDTAYLAVSGREEIRVRLRWTLVDAEARRALEEGAEWARTGARFERAEYRGDPGTLALTRAERERFDAWRADEKVEREMARELVGEVAPGLAREVFDRVRATVR